MLWYILPAWIMHTHYYNSGSYANERHYSGGAEYHIFGCADRRRKQPNLKNQGSHFYINGYAHRGEVHSSVSFPLMIAASFTVNLIYT